MLETCTHSPSQSHLRAEGRHSVTRQGPHGLMTLWFCLEEALSNPFSLFSGLLTADSKQGTGTLVVSARHSWDS